MFKRGLKKVKYKEFFIILYLFVLIAGMFFVLADSEVGAKSTSISSCQEISSPGVYVLQNDITGVSGRCFYITTSDVVLDGNGSIVQVNSNFENSPDGD